MRTGGFASADEARSWLREVAVDASRHEAEVTAALAVANRALHAHSLAAAEPNGLQLSRTQPVATRLGYGTGDEVAAGRWSEAVEVPPEPAQRRRVDALRPGERVAAVLGGRDRPLACETLVLRARADLDAGRDREAAIQLRGGIAALLAELGDEPSDEQRPDVEALRERSPHVDEIAARALRAEVGGGERADLEEALALAERVLRRRRILGR